MFRRRAIVSRSQVEKKEEAAEYRRRRGELKAQLHPAFAADESPTFVQLRLPFNFEEVGGPHRPMETKPSPCGDEDSELARC